MSTPTDLFLAIRVRVHNPSPDDEAEARAIGTEELNRQGYEVLTVALTKDGEETVLCVVGQLKGTR